MKYNVNIIHLNLSNNPLTENSSAILENILKFNVFLEELNLSNTNLKDKGIEILYNCLIDNKSLKNLDLSKNNITCEGANFLKKMLNLNSFLEILNISSNKLNDENDNQTINDGFKLNKSLKIIDISDCNYTDKSIIYLFEILIENKNIEILKLNYNEINEEGMIKISELMSNNRYNIHTLSLSGIYFNEKSCRYLSNSLKFNQYLKNVKVLF